MRSESAVVTHAVLVAAGLGCVSEAPLPVVANECAAADGGVAETTPPPATGQESYFPLAVGNSWTYRTGQGIKIWAVEAEEAVGGDGPYATTTAFRISDTINGQLISRSWQGFDPPGSKRIVRYREVDNPSSTSETYWVPPRLRVDDGATPGMQWREVYVEHRTGVPAFQDAQDWVVAATGEAVTITGRSGEVTSHADCMRVIHSAKNRFKTFWWCRGVGKVKETEGEDTEELVSLPALTGSASPPGR